MAILTLSYEANNAANLQALFDSGFSTLLNHRILDFDVVWADDNRQSVQKQLAIIVTVEDIGATITEQFKLKVFQGATQSAVEAAYQAFIAANPAYFVSAPEYAFGSNASTPSRYTLACLYNEDPAEAYDNWFFGQKGYSTISYAAAADPTTGTWDQGDRRFESDAAAGGTVGTVCTTAGTFGTLSGVTGSITNATASLEVSDASDLRVGMYITIVGVTGVKKILAISGTTVTLDSNSDATVTDADVAYQTPVFKAFGDIAA